MNGASLGPYRIERRLGSGGMGTVYLGVVERDAAGLARGVRVAVKVVHPHLVATPGAVARFLREAAIGKAVRHENVVRTFDVDVASVDGSPTNYLAMEFVEGRTLRALLDEIVRAPDGLCRHVGREIAKGLAAIHAAGAVHRDLKPENVLVTPDHVVKVMDLGVAQIADESVRLSQTGAFAGSVQYAAPEQFTPGENVDARTDLHGLGVLLYEMACGVRPYAAEEMARSIQRLRHETPRRLGEMNPQASPFLEEVVHVLLAKRREDRFATAAEVARILEDGESSSWWTAKSAEIAERAERPRRARVPRETSLHGRADEMEQLRALFDRACAGEGGAALIEGEAGIGKTRLAEEFAGELEREGVPFHLLSGAWPSGGAATAADAFAAALRPRLGNDDVALRAALRQTPLLVPSFAALLRGDLPPAGAEPLTKDSTQTLFVHAVRSLAGERPTLLLVDDLHFAPEEGRALFAALAQALRGHRALLVGTSRPGLHPAWTSNLDRIGVRRIPLARLGPQDLSRLLVEALHSERVAEELCAKIAAKSDGNPFFVFEIVRGLRDARFVAQRPDGTWTTTSRIEEIEIPSSVLGLVQTRLAGLAQEEREVLDAASCIGFEFDPSLVAAVLRTAKIPLLRRLARIENAHRLVRSAGPKFVFDHRQAQEAVYAGIPAPRRAALHAAVAEAMERVLTGAPSGDERVALADHFLRGGLGGRALPHLDAALAHLVSTGRLERASDLAKSALQTPDLVRGADRARLLERVADLLDHLGRREEALAALDEAAAAADAVDRGARAQIQIVRARVLVGSGRSDDAARILDDTLSDGAAPLSRELEMRARAVLGNIAFAASRFEDTMRHLRAQLECARETGDAGAEAAALGNLASCQFNLGRIEESIANYDRSLALCASLGPSFRRLEGVYRGNHALALVEIGHLARALDEQRRTLDLQRSLGVRRGEAVALVNLGPLEHKLGDTERARDFLQAALALAVESTFPYAEGYALCDLGRVEADAGRFDEAERLFAEARALRERIGHAGGLAEVAVASGRARAAAGDSAGAVRLFRDGLARARLLKIPNATVAAASELAAASGDAAALVEAEAALAEHQETLGVYERMSAGFVLWRAAGDPAHLAEAKRRLDFLVEHSPPDRRRAMLANVRLHREIAEAAIS